LHRLTRSLALVRTGAIYRDLEEALRCFRTVSVVEKVASNLVRPLSRCAMIGAVFFQTKDVVRDKIVQTVLEYL
jgi:hypothetical protein